MVTKLCMDAIGNRGLNRMDDSSEIDPSEEKGRDAEHNRMTLAEYLIARGATSIEIAALVAPDMDGMTLAERIERLLTPDGHVEAAGT
jgi:uncharacterized protein (DUF934 family)